MRILKRLLCCLLILLILGTPAVFAVDYTNEAYLSTAWDVTLGALDGVTGATCGIKGEVTYFNATEVFLQDITGGICARFAAAPTVSVGQTVTVVGQASDNHGLPELNNARVVLTAEGTKPAAVPTDLDQLQTYPRLYLNRLIRLEGVTVARIGEDGAPVLSDGSRELACYGLTTALPVGTTVDAELVFTVYDGSYRLRGSGGDIREKGYTLTVKQFGLGSITPAACTLPAGSSQRLTFTPADGERLEQVWLNGQALGRVSEYTVENIQEDYTVCAVFLAAYEMPPDGSFSITTSCTPGGSISPSRAVDFFGSSTVAVTPSEGWHVKDVQLDGTSVGAVESYAVYNAEADHTVTADFERCYLISDAVPATCTQEGGSVSLCTLCGRLTNHNDTPALGHAWVTTDEDYLYRYQSCSRCGEKTLTAKAPPAYKDSPSAQFTDIPEGWYRTAADYMLSEGLMGSTVTGKSVFAPMTDMSRAMLVTVLYRLEGSQKIENPTKTFTDVPDGMWYTEAVLWAADKEIVAGTKDGTTFSPNDSITREQIAAILYNYCVSYKKLRADKAAELSFFPDAGEAGTWAHTALRWAVAEGLINGRASGGRTLLAPKGSAMRCEVAVVLTSLVKNILIPASFAG